MGFYPYEAFRTFMVMALPPALTVIVQWLILRIAVRPKEGASPPAEPRDESVIEPIPFPKE